MDDSGLKV